MTEHKTIEPSEAAPVRLPIPDAARISAIETARHFAAKGTLEMIDFANNKPENRGRKPKVGGHQASSMSLLDVLSCLYLHAKRPQDRIAVKPHAAPALYSLMHLMGVMPADQLDRLRERGGPQPYPTKLKDPLFVDYTTSSEALGVCAAVYDAYGAKVQNRALRGHGAPQVDALYYGLSGDGELTEGQIDESLYDAGRWGLENLVWVVDLNRQSLDRVMDDTTAFAPGQTDISRRLDAWVEAKFRGQGWHVAQLRWGAKALSLFDRPGGTDLQAALERADDATLHPIVRLPGAITRSLLLGEEPESAGVFAPMLQRAAQMWPRTEQERQGIAKAIENLPDADLSAAVGDLGGHDATQICQALSSAAAHQGQPTVIIAHTIKGFDTSAAAHPENHGMLLPSDEVHAWGHDKGLPEGVRYPRPDASSAAGELLAERSRVLFSQPDHSYHPGGHDAPKTALAGVRLAKRTVTSTGEAFQSLNMALLRTELAPWMHFGAPDVGQTTHLGPIIKSTGVFAPRDLPNTLDFMRDELAFDWRPSETGQFHAMGIAEGNAMLWAYAFGRQKKQVEGKLPLLPVVTVYDKFFERGFNQLDYAAYSGGRFIAVGVPSGTGLSRETGTHQSVQTPRMIMDLPQIVAYEPAFAADVHAIYRWALGQLWDEDGEAVYLRLSTQPFAQPKALPEDHEAQAISGGYWLGEAPAQTDAVIVASGRMVARAQEAADQLAAADNLGVRVLNVTSYEQLWRQWDAWNNDPDAWNDPERSYRLHELFGDVEVNAPLVLIGDHHPSVCEWLPGALQRLGGYRILAPRRNSEAGDLDDIDRLHGTHTDDVVAAIRAELRWRKTR
ncbi:MAG: hypothetical protein KC502_09920 [Myxococcales bacterium]|nr:hypothetical protein [Myxococcales bacterium]